MDALEEPWPSLRRRYPPHSLVLNLDNGPENHSHRTQFVKRIVDFAKAQQVEIKLGYCPLYHSKYNPIERVWRRLENHWNGELLDSVEKVLGLAGTMQWKGKLPIVKEFERDYATGVKLSKAEMKVYEEQIERHKGLEKDFVTIPRDP